MRTSYNIATRAQVLCIKISRATNTNIKAVTGISETRIKNLVKIARERGFDETKDRRILNIYLKDRDQLGRPKKRTSAKIKQVLNLIRYNQYSREKSTLQLSLNAGDIGALIVWRILYLLNIRKTKPIHKPGLIAQIKKDRLKFCLRYKD